MTSRWTELAYDCHDPEHLAGFWSAALGWSVVDRAEGVVEIGPGDRGPTIVFCPVPETKTIKNRLHIDVRAIDGDQTAEVERLIELGATTVDVGQGDVSWVVLADPEGNEFCVLSGRP